MPWFIFIRRWWNLLEATPDCWPSSFRVAEREESQHGNARLDWWSTTCIHIITWYTDERWEDKVSVTKKKKKTRRENGTTKFNFAWRAGNFPIWFDWQLYNFVRIIYIPRESSQRNVAKVVEVIYATPYKEKDINTINGQNKKKILIERTK